MKNIYIFLILFSCNSLEKSTHDISVELSNKELALLNDCVRILNEEYLTQQNIDLKFDDKLSTGGFIGQYKNCFFNESDFEKFNYDQQFVDHNISFRIDIDRLNKKSNNKLLIYRPIKVDDKVIVLIEIAGNNDVLLYYLFIRDKEYLKHCSGSIVS